MDVVILLIVIFGLLFDYTNGFHDAANVVSTVIATKALKPMAAIVMAAVLNFLGATQISGVAQTITTGLVTDASQAVVLSALLGAITWNFITWYYGIPSSSSYALIGALLGAGYLHAGAHAILWDGLTYKVILPMIFSPIIGLTVAYLTMKMLFSKQNAPVFRHLQIGSAALVALAHGLNDAQKSMGIITLGLLSAGLLKSPEIPLWVIGACALFMAIGTATGGWRIIHTLGYKITTLTPPQGFVAEASSAAIILGASFLGMPISSTHMITGSIAGVGLAKSASAISKETPKKLLGTWLLTLPCTFLVGGLFYSVLQFLPN